MTETPVRTSVTRPAASRRTHRQLRQTQPLAEPTEDAPQDAGSSSVMQRMASILVGAAIGALLFKERFGALRITAAGLLVVRIGLMLYAG